MLEKNCPRLQERFKQTTLSTRKIFLSFTTFTQEVEVSLSSQTDRSTQFLSGNPVAIVVKGFIKVVSPTPLNPLRLQRWTERSITLTCQYCKIKRPTPEVIDQH